VNKKSQKLNKRNLKKLNDIAHLKSFPTKIKSLNIKYEDFDLFINDFEYFISTELKTPSKDLSLEDKIFEGIINRLDFLNYYKNITLRIYLESQKKPKYFLNLLKNINIYFNSFLITNFEKTISNIIYFYAFNVWVEDNNNMDKTMASIGNAFENINRLKSFLKKK
tara:strand:- start:2608 stop:3105 length:498 start_codon:yes stop_codon:yes gene_type:complete